MCDAPTILAQARAAGLRVWRNGGRISVAPAGRCPPALLDRIRASKPAILTLLDAEAAGLFPDQAPWLPAARQVLAGEFDGGTRSELEAVWIGVRGIRHPVCQEARGRLETLLGRKRKEVLP